MIVAAAVSLPAASPAPRDLSWGHLPSTWMLRPGERVFLINHPPREPYDICVSDALAQKHPTIEAELGAAVNVWAHYIGRRIDVRTTRRKITPAKMKTAACGPTFDMVVGQAPMPAQALGETGFTRTTTVTRRGKSKTSRDDTSARYLLIRDLDAAPVTVEGGKRLRWSSYRDVFPSSAAQTSTQILERLLRRDTALYANDGKVAMLAILVHELGHVWGLCDLYASQQQCDPKNAGRTTLPEGRDAIMGPVLFRQPLYLSDDDVHGIRALALRSGFDPGWRVPASTLRAQVAPTRLPDVEIFTAKLLRPSRGKLQVDASVVTNRPAKLTVEGRQGKDGDWQKLSPETVGDPKLSKPFMSFVLDVTGVPSALQLRLRLDYRGSDGKWASPRFVTF